MNYCDDGDLVGVVDDGCRCMSVSVATVERSGKIWENPERSKDPEIRSDAESVCRIQIVSDTILANLQYPTISSSSSSTSIGVGTRHVIGIASTHIGVKYHDEILPRDIMNNYSMSLVTFALLTCWLRLAPRCSSFVPTRQFFDRSLHLHLKRRLPTVSGFSLHDKSALHITRHSFLQATSTSSVLSEPTVSEIPQKEFSYAAILKVIDESHYQEATESCTYLATETLTCGKLAGAKSTQSGAQRYQSPAAPVLSEDAVRELRSAAQKYFEAKGRENNAPSTIDRVELGDLLSIDAGQDPEWRKNLDAALMDEIYPLIRSSWLRHDESDRRRTSANDVQPDILTVSPVLTVTSASVFAGGLYFGAKAALTTLERDAGMFMVHIDLGNDDHIGDDGETPVMGALYVESLINDDRSKLSESIAGPLLPGQMVLHKSSERTAAIVVPSDIHDVMGNCESTKLDSMTRTQILRAAERARHFILRLVLTTKTHNAVDAVDGIPLDIPEAPSEERSYRLRNYARFSGQSRGRYLTLAGLLDLGDYENHLWLGFDYIARIENPDYHFDLRQRLSVVNKAVFHFETAAKLCPTDSRVFFQLATAIGAKMECEQRLLSEGVNGHNFVTESDEVSNLLRMADALERSAYLESAAVKVGVNGVQDLAICLNALAETWCKAGEFDKALDALDRWAECGSIRSALSIEDTSAQLHENSPRYEWIQSTDETRGNARKIALKTVGDVPVFEPEDIALLRAAADKRFALAHGVQTSRYTMQYEGLSVFHINCMLL